MTLSVLKSGHSHLTRLKPSSLSNSIRPNLKFKFFTINTPIKYNTCQTKRALWAQDIALLAIAHLRNKTKICPRYIFRLWRRPLRPSSKLAPKGLPHDLTQPDARHKMLLLPHPNPRRRSYPTRLYRVSTDMLSDGNMRKLIWSLSSFALKNWLIRRLQHTLYWLSVKLGWLSLRLSWRNCRGNERWLQEYAHIWNIYCKACRRGVGRGSSRDIGHGGTREKVLGPDCFL